VAFSQPAREENEGRAVQPKNLESNKTRTNMCYRRILVLRNVCAPP
jgi:hypothetical protein